VSMDKSPRRYALIKLHIYAILALGMLLLTAHGVPALGHVLGVLFRQL
jgi:hypothetical protein